MNDLILFEIYGHPCLSASVEGEFPTGVTPVKMEIFKIFAHIRKLSPFYVYWSNLVLLARQQSILWVI